MTQPPASVPGDIAAPQVQVERIASEAIATLDRYLGYFHDKGYPGRACLRSGWIREGAIAEDHARVARLRAELAQEPVPLPPRRVAEHVTAWPIDNAEAVAALTLYTGHVPGRDFDWFEAVGVVETILRGQIADELHKIAGLNAHHGGPLLAVVADQIRNPERATPADNNGGSDG